DTSALLETTHRHCDSHLLCRRTTSTDLCGHRCIATPSKYKCSSQSPFYPAGGPPPSEPPAVSPCFLPFRGNSLWVTNNRSPIPGSSRVNARDRLTGPTVPTGKVYIRPAFQLP